MVTIGTESAGTQDLRAYFRIFWRWRFLFLAIVVAIPVAVYLLERGKPKTYQSSTLIELQDVSVSLGTTSAPVQTGNIDAVARLVTTTPVAKVAAGPDPPAPEHPGFMVKAVSATADSTTGFVTITAQAGEPAARGRHRERVRRRARRPSGTGRPHRRSGSRSRASSRS